MHGIALLIPSGFGIYALVFDLFQPVLAGYCYVADRCEFARLGMNPTTSSTSSSMHSQQDCGTQQVQNSIRLTLFSIYMTAVIMLIFMGSIYLSERKKASPPSSSVSRIGNIGNEITTEKRINDHAEASTQALL